MGSKKKRFCNKVFFPRCVSNFVFGALFNIEPHLIIATLKLIFGDHQDLGEPSCIDNNFMSAYHGIVLSK